MPPPALRENHEKRFIGGFHNLDELIKDEVPFAEKIQGPQEKTQV
jgi:hypothetical protein